MINWNLSLGPTDPLPMSACQQVLENQEVAFKAAQHADTIFMLTALLIGLLIVGAALAVFYYGRKNIPEGEQ